MNSSQGRGAQLIYPNYRKQPPGARIHFWQYDPEKKDWYTYGLGTVTADGKQVVPDPDVQIYVFNGAMISSGGNPPAVGPLPGNTNSSGGDPVDLATGLFVLSQTDLFLPDVLPISLTRTYRPQDSQSRPFGIGSTHPYDMLLWSPGGYQECDLVLPDGGRIHYVRISPGTAWWDAVFEHTATPTAFYKSQVTWNGTGWDLTLKDGTVYVYGDAAPLYQIRDRYGNKIQIMRAGSNGIGNPTGNITKIVSPNGRFIELTYDASNRITQAKDNVGRTVGYTYDASGRLWKVTDPAGGITEYTYDASHRMLTIKDARAIVYLTNEYDANGRVTRQTLADSSIFQFAYTVDANNKVTQADLTDPRGMLRRLTLNSSSFTLTETDAVGRPEQQTVSYGRQVGTNFLTSVTDPLGRRTDYTYDSKGNLASVTRPAGTPEALTTSFTYEATYSQLASATDPRGQSTTFTYDAKGNITAVTDPLGNATTFTYNSSGRPLTATSPLGKVTNFAYELGDLVNITDPLGRQANRFVDEAGRLVGVTNPAGPPDGL